MRIDGGWVNPWPHACQQARALHATRVARASVRDMFGIMIMPAPRNPCTAWHMPRMLSRPMQYHTECILSMTSPPSAVHIPRGRMRTCTHVCVKRQCHCIATHRCVRVGKTVHARKIARESPSSSPHHIHFAPPPPYQTFQAWLLVVFSTPLFSGQEWPSVDPGHCACPLKAC